MRIHITNLYGQSPQSVALMSQNMVTEIANSLGFKEIGIYNFCPDLSNKEAVFSRFDGMNAAVGSDDIVIIQSPTWNGTEYDLAYIRRLKIYSNIKLAVFIHDVIPLMFTNNFYLMDQTIEMYNLADLVIAPSQKMLDTLRGYGLTVEKVIIQHMWDHPTELRLDSPKFERLINFAGSPDRFPFLYDWKYETNLRLFSDKRIDDPDLNIKSEGWRYSIDLLNSLSQNGGFGLVWPQGGDGNYYELNISYKLSTYLAAGIPVIIPKTLSNASIIEKNNLGFVVENLQEANDLVSIISEDHYRFLLNNVWEYRELLIRGDYTRKLLIDTVHSLLTTD